MSVSTSRWNSDGSYAGEWVTRSVRRRSEPAFYFDAVLEFDALDDFGQLIFALQPQQCEDLHGLAR
jgi:hypothetical protein